MDLLPLWIGVIVNLLLVIQTHSNGEISSLHKYVYVQLSGLLYHFHSPFKADDCVFEYTQQPPSCLSCNPYNNATSPPQLELTLACGARRNDDKKNEWTFDLRWFSNYSSKALPHTTDIRKISFTNISVVVTSPGQYWCQVLDYTYGRKYLLGRSNVAEILSWEWYSSLPMCKGIQSVMESKCGDFSPSSSAINDLPMCSMPKTKIQTRVITGEHLCMLFVCCTSAKLMK